MNRISENSNKDTNYTNNIPKTEYFSACYSLIEDAQYNCMLINKNKNQAFVEWLYTFSKEHIKSISLTPKKTIRNHLYRISNRKILYEICTRLSQDCNAKNRR